MSKCVVSSMLNVLKGYVIVTTRLYGSKKVLSKDDYRYITVLWMVPRRYGTYFPFIMQGPRAIESQYSCHKMTSKLHGSVQLGKLEWRDGTDLTL